MSHKIDTQLTSEKREDLRVRRTELMVHQAFMDLVVDVGFNAITIQMLADRAMINRATFYRHYQDIHDLVEKVYLTLIAEYFESVQPYMPGHPVEALQCLFEHCGRYAAFYQALLSDLPYFQKLNRDHGEQQLAAFFKQIGVDPQCMTVPLPIVSRYWITAQIGVVQWWLESGQQIPAREMAQYVWQLLENGAISQLSGLPQE